MFALFRLRDKGFLSDGEYARLVRRLLSSCATWSIACKWTKIGRPTRCPTIRHRLDLLARKMPPDANGAPWMRAGLKQRLAGTSRRPCARFTIAWCTRYRQPATPRCRTARAVPEEPDAPPRRSQSGARARRARAAPRRRARRRQPAPRPRALRAFPGKGRGHRRTCWRASKRRPTAVLRYLRAQRVLRRPDLCATRNCWTKSASRSSSKADPSRTAPPCAVSTAARCCASSAKACSAARPSSRRSARPACWPIRVIAAAYRIALVEAPPPAGAGYSPNDQMMVISLGRLGMQRVRPRAATPIVNFVHPR